MELADVQAPGAKGFYVEEVQSQTDRVQMLRDLGAALNQPLSPAPEKWAFYLLVRLCSGFRTIMCESSVRARGGAPVYTPPGLLPPAELGLEAGQQVHAHF